MEKNKISKNANIKVYWDDLPENYSRESKSKIKSYFSNKYGVSKTNIDVIFRAVKVDASGNLIDMTQIGIDNIMDINYQRQLFKEWIEREKKVVDFDRLIALDDKVNAALNNGDSDIRQRKYKLKWIKVDNFLCFGELPAIHLTKLKGIVAIASTPKNQGGKCMRSNTKIIVNYNADEIIKKLGFLPDELK